MCYQLKTNSINFIRTALFNQSILYPYNHNIKRLEVLEYMRSISTSYQRSGVHEKVSPQWHLFVFPVHIVQYHCLYVYAIYAIIRSISLPEFVYFNVGGRYLVLKLILYFVWVPGSGLALGEILVYSPLLIVHYYDIPLGDGT